MPQSSHNPAVGGCSKFGKGKWRDKKGSHHVWNSVKDGPHLASRQSHHSQTSHHHQISLPPYLSFSLSCLNLDSLNVTWWAKFHTKVGTPIHDNIRELVTWECNEHGVNIMNVLANPKGKCWALEVEFLEA